MCNWRGKFEVPVIWNFSHFETQNSICDKIRIKL